MISDKWIVGLVLGAVILSQPGAAFAASDKQSRTLSLPSSRAMSIAVTIGTVQIDGVAGQEATLVVKRHAPAAADLQRILLEIEETDREVRVRCMQRDGTDPALRCDITVRIPREALVTSIQVMEGLVKLAGLTGAVTADIRRGSIDAADVQGTMRLESGIGNVVVHQARLTPSGLLRLRAFNGDVRLSLAERPRDARILALALNGTIKSEIPLTRKETWGPRWGEATLGKGEPVISLDVITGRIEIKSPD